MTEKDKSADVTITGSDTRKLTGSGLPKPGSENPWQLQMWNDGENTFSVSPFISAFYRFYISTLGLSPYKTVLYNSLDNPIYFVRNKSDDNNTIYKNNYQILSVADKIFHNNTIDPGKNQKFSKFYCKMITNLRQGYNLDISTNGSEKRSKLIKEVIELKKIINDSNTDYDIRQLYVRDYQIKIEQIKSLQDSGVFIALEDAKQSCEMVQCDSTVTCKNHDKQKLSHYTMKIKEPSSEAIHYVPKATFGISVDNLFSTTESKLYHDLINKVRKGELEPEKLAEHLDYFQVYDAYQLFKDVKMKGKVMVAFEKVTHVPIEFGEWYDSNIYQIAVKDKEITLNSDYLIYTKFCRMPRKVIIATKPTIIYSDSMRHSKVPKGFEEESPVNSTHYNVVSRTHEESMIVLGYEVDDTLCHSPLIGAFESYNKHSEHPEHSEL